MVNDHECNQKDLSNIDLQLAFIRELDGKSHSGIMGYDLVSVKNISLVSNL